MKYDVTVSVITTAYAGIVEADDPKEAWTKARELVKTLKSKYVRADDADEDRLYFDDLESVEPADESGGGAVLPKWR